MRGTGDFKYLLTLYGKGAAGLATEKMGEIYAARRTISGKEFLDLGAMHQEQTAIFTIRRPVALQIDAGIEVTDHQGRRWRVAAITPNSLYGTCMDLRCVSVEVEGSGYA